jgi:hypothetical protein
MSYFVFFLPATFFSAGIWQCQQHILQVIECTSTMIPSRTKTHLEKANCQSANKITRAPITTSHHFIFMSIALQGDQGKDA